MSGCPFHGFAKTPLFKQLHQNVARKAVADPAKCPFMQIVAHTGTPHPNILGDNLKNLDQPRFPNVPDVLQKHFDGFLHGVHKEGRYRVFNEIERHASSFPHATRYTAESTSPIVVWCSNDYLGMGQQTEVVEACMDAVKKWGTGAGGTRNISGTTHSHALLEKELAAWHSKEAALVFTSGYVANETTLSTLGTLLPNCIYFSDDENHASMIAGMKAKGTQKRIWRHNDVEHLRELLQEAHEQDPKACKIVAFESVYSMSGTIAPIKEICQVAKEFGALTYCDEVHAVGMYGRWGAGVTERDEIINDVDIVQATLGKAVGVIGGYIASSATIVDCIRSQAPGFIFTTSLPPHVASAALASVRYLRSEEGLDRRMAFHSTVSRVKQLMRDASLPLMEGDSHICPLFVGDPTLCKKASDILLDQHGIYVQPINYPTVSRGTERLRITPSPVHSEELCNQLITALREVWIELDLPFADKESSSGTEYERESKLSTSFIDAHKISPLARAIM